MAIDAPFWEGPADKRVSALPGIAESQADIILKIIKPEDFVTFLTRKLVELY